MDTKLRVALLALALTLAAMAAPVFGADRARPALKDLVASMGGDPAHAGMARYAYLRKLDSHLQKLVAGKTSTTTGVTAPIVGGVKVTPGSRVLVDVYVNGDIAAAAGDLRALGMDVRAVSRRAPQRMVEGYLPLDAATKAAALDATEAVVPVTGSGTDTGSVLSQGDAAEHGPQARALGPTGAGVTVGVMSDSINQVGSGVAGSQASGNLPATVTVLHEQAGGTDEGRAMAEIVYDEAPGITKMLFDTGAGGAATKASHIAELVSNGAKVIADDTFYLGEPFFQDDTVAQAVDAAKAAGTAYVTAAGNHARQSWEGTFTAGAGGDNNFGGGDVDQAIVTVPAGATLTGELQWDEPWGAATTDLDALVYVNGSLFAAGSGETDNIASGIPAEFFGVQAGGSAINVSLRINRFAGTGAPKIKYILSNNFGPFTIGEHDTSSSSISPDAAAAEGSLAVAAVCWSTNIGNCFGAAGLQTPESFSSRGPVVRTRDANGSALAAPDVRQKPNVAGADGVATSVTNFNPFFGTSAAAPSVAGVAALAFSAKPSLTVDQLYAILTDPNASLDCISAAGDPDTDCGAGFIQADRAVTEARDTTPPVLTPTVTPAAPDGAHGWYLAPVSVTWDATDADSVMTGKAGCAPLSVTTDTAGMTSTCSATSIGGTANGSVTIKRDTSPPSAPAFTGISMKKYLSSSVPASSAIGCTASDPTSGVDGCTVVGYSKAAGTHTLTATATNDAGLPSTSTLTYSVAKPQCKVPKLKGKTLAAAKKALRKAHCRLGKTKPKHPSSKFRVTSSSPKAGRTKPANAKVKLTFKKKK